MEKYKKLAIEVQEVYQISGSTFNSFQEKSGLTCLSGCGKCCLNPDITATMLEMLPIALDLIEKREDQEVYQILESEVKQCIFYEKHDSSGTKGKCTIYNFRPSICRSFGASARFKKDGQKDWIVCKLIKEKDIKKLDKVNINEAPIMGHFASQISVLDTDLGSKSYPINTALKLMLEKLLFLKGLKDNDSI